MKGKGSEEFSMQKSVGSVFSNNILASSTVGHLLNLDPYIEPAANMDVSRNIFFDVNTTDTALDVTTNSYTTATLQHSCSLFTSARNIAIYNFSNTTVPSLQDPVVRQLDYNTYFRVAGFNVSALQAQGWEAHALLNDPGFRALNASHEPYALTHLDFALDASAPVVQQQGFVPIPVEAMGLPPGSALTAQLQAIMARDGAAKIQAESYQRMRGLWHAGSFAITPGPHNFPFATPSWARYDNVDAWPAAARSASVRGAAPQGAVVRLALGSPASPAVCVVNLPPGATLDVINGTCTLPSAPAPFFTVFLFLDRPATIDWFRFI